MHKITVLIPICNPDIEMFIKMLRSLKMNTPEIEHLIVIDNASTDSEKIEEKVHGIMKDDILITFTKNIVNVGFGRAINQALPFVLTKYMAIMNDDIEIFEPWATKMIDIMESDDKVAQVVPKHGVCNTWINGVGGHWKDVEEPEYAEASLMMTRTDLMKQYGGFDDIYQKAYCEDGDLSLRFRKDGYKIKNVPVNWKHYRATTTLKVPIDIFGYYVVNKHTFDERWNAYLIAKRFGETVVFQRGGSIGDVFLLIPVIQRWKELHPEDVIVVQTQELTKQAIKECDLIDLFHPYMMPIACNKFFNLDYSYEKDFRKSILGSYEEIVGIDLNKRTGTVYASQRDVDYVQGLLSDCRMEKTIAFELSDTWSAKKWEDVNYIRLMNLVQADGYKTIGLGKRTKPFEFPFYRNLINRLTPIQTAIAMHYCNAFVGHEGLLSHFAQALNMPAVVLYGCTKPELVNDLSQPDLYKTITGHVACQGCRHRYNAGTAIHCPRKDRYQCMKSITVDEVNEQLKLVRDINNDANRTIVSVESDDNTPIVQPFTPKQEPDNLLKVFFAGNDTGGSGYVRIITPALFLEQRCNNVQVGLNITSDQSFINKSNVVVIQRAVHPDAIQLLQSLQQHGKKIVYELDDDLWHLPDGNPHKVLHLSKPENLRTVEKIISMCDAVTTSTEPLAEILRKFNKNIHVLQNSIEFTSWMDDPKPENEKVRIGWAGSYQHKPDFAVCSAALLEIARSYGDKVQLIFMGMIPDEFVGIAEHHPFVEYQKYMGELQRLNLDIAVLPLTDTTFNRSRSNQKFIDMSALHIPSIASPVFPYSMIVHEETGLIVKKNRHGEWLRKLTHLIEDVELRKGIAENANRFTKENYDIQYNIRRWEKVYRSLIILQHSIT